MPLEDQLREKHECLKALAGQVKEVVGDARNYTGFQPPALQLPVDEDTEAAERVRCILSTGDNSSAH